MVLAYLCEHLDQHSPDVLLLNCGLHDLRTDPQTGAKQVALDDYRRNLGEIVCLVQRHKVRTVWAQTTPVDDETHNTPRIGFHRCDRDVIAYNAVADTVFGSVEAPILDLYTFTRSLGDHVYIDHVHFTERVRALQAAFIAGALFALEDSGVG